MTGMTLVAALQENSTMGRKETGSTVSTTEDFLQQVQQGSPSVTSSKGQHQQHMAIHHPSPTAPFSAPPSPSSERQQLGGGGGGVSLSTTISVSKQIPSRHPPGMGGLLPSPVVNNPGHSKNSSATSPLLTLTPNSSVDGNNSEWAVGGAGGRHGSSPNPGSSGEGAAPPSMPYLSSTAESSHRRLQSVETSSFGSFDSSGENDNDGLLGLEALRERASRATAPPPPPPPPPSYSTSPPMIRGYFASSHGGGDDRPRIRDRPPLSHSAYAQEGSSSSYAGDRSVGERSTGSLGFTTTASASSSSYHNPNNVSMESADALRGFGAIARPELRQSATEFDPNRRRSFSSDNFQHSQQYMAQQQQLLLQQQQQQHQHNVAMQEQEQLSQKFAALTTLGSHLQQQRVHGQQQESYADIQKPRHIRSASQPMQGQSSALGAIAQMDPRSYGGGMSSSGSAYDSTFNSNKPAPLYRGSSAHSGSSMSGSYDQGGGGGGSVQYNNSQKRASLPNYTGNPYGQPSSSSHSSLPRQRDALDFQLEQQRFGAGGGEDMRIFGSASMISPGQSPMQTHYGGVGGGGHSRNHSDAASGMLSSSPMSMNSGVLRASHGGQAPAYLHHGSMGGLDDDDLIGENIEVPADHFSGSGCNSPAYGSLTQLSSMPLMRAPHHSHSVSYDQLPTLYQDSSQHHLPTAGSALPLPKVVYIVKFKQTQRNFVLGPRITRDLKIGTYVKVEADRGEDLGIVVGRVPADKYNFANRNQYTAGMGPPQGSLGTAGAADLKRIIRLATHDEVSLLGMKRDEEDELLKICRSKVRQRGLHMNVVDAEYQFDRHKLTFFFEAEGRVDFRELVRDLFSIYKTRIWMQQLDKNTSSSTPAIVAPLAASLQMDYGTPIIAPPSEFADSVVLNGMGDARSH
jgi:PSP1 C-terminal conserved region